MKLGPRRSEDVIAAAMAGKHLDNEESAHVCADLITAAAAEIRQGNFQPAIEKLDKCLEIDPGNSYALTDLAAAYTSWANQFYNQKQYARAAELFAKTLTYLDKQAKPENDSEADVVGIYFFCLRQSGNEAQARKVEAIRHIVSPTVNATRATNEAQKVDADSAVVTETNLAKARKKPDSQSLVAQTTTESNNESTHNACVDLNNSANHDITAGNNKAAVEKLEKCLHMEPGYALAADNLEVAYYNWGIQLYSQHQYAAAVDMLAKALNCLDKLANPQKEKLMDCLKAYALSLQLSGNDAGAQKAQERLDKISAN
jgi:tetratricopeptide (TPR) repeat protein